MQDFFRIGHFDNSWKDDMDPANIDLALFAGSPEWYGRRLKGMYTAIEKGNIPTVFLGVGAGDSVDFSKSDPIVDRVLSKALVITARDKATEKLLKKYGAIYMPCPAFLAAANNRAVERVNKIGLIYATHETVKGNNVSKEMHDYIVPLYKELAKVYNVGIVCHYIDEIDKAKTELPGLEIYYSYDSKDYAEIYNQFDLVIGGRVHGIGMSASLGIPGVMIKHDSRSSTTDGFLASSVQIGDLYEKVNNLVSEITSNVQEYSERLIQHKEMVMLGYLDVLKNKLQI